MAVVVGRMVALLEANTANFEARMVAAEQKLGRFTSHTATAGRGLVFMRSGIEQVAFAATGAAGPVGRLASGIGMLALGTGPTIAILAGLAAIALAYKKIGEAGKLAAENQERALERMRTNIQKAVAGVSFEVSSAALAQAIAQRQALLTTAPRAPTREESIAASLGNLGREAIPGTAENIAARVAALDNVISNLQVAIHVAGEDAADALAGVTMELARLNTELAFVGRAVGPMVGVPERLAARLQGVPLADTQRGLISLNARRRFAPDAPAEPTGFKVTPEFAIMSAMSLLQGAQMGPAGFFGAAAGPVSMINPLAGAITAGVGGIFSLFNRDEDRRHRELIERLERIANEVGLERVTVVFTGPDGQQIRKSLAELEAGDAVERIPSPTGATG